MGLPTLVQVKEWVQPTSIRERIESPTMRGLVREIIDRFADSDYFSLFKSRMEAMTHHHSTALATAEHQMNMNKFGYYSCAAPEIAASLLEDWDAGHIPHLKSLIASSGYELLIAKSGIGSFLIEVIAPAIIHLWIAGDLECSQSQALEVLVDQRAGDYGRLILNPEFMNRWGQRELMSLRNNLRRWQKVPGQDILSPRANSQALLLLIAGAHGAEKEAIWMKR